MLLTSLLSWRSACCWWGMWTQLNGHWALASLAPARLTQASGNSFRCVEVLWRVASEEMVCGSV